MSRPRKPVELLKLDGTYRADRHSDRSDNIAHGRPEPPEWLDDDALFAWEIITANFHPSVLKATDTLTLAAACKWWSRWRRFDRQLDVPEVDPYKISVMAATAWKACEKCLSKLGLNPTDRAKLRAEPDEQTEDPKAKFFKTG